MHKTLLGITIQTIIRKQALKTASMHVCKFQSSLLHISKPLCIEGFSNHPWLLSPLWKKGSMKIFHILYEKKASDEICLQRLWTKYYIMPVGFDIWRDPIRTLALAVQPITGWHYLFKPVASVQVASRQISNQRIFEIAYVTTDSESNIFARCSQFVYPICLLLQTRKWL